MSFKLEEMTTKDKLKAMEVLWDDICRNLPDFLSPAWHENILKEREHKLRISNFRKPIMISDHS
jgi:hypothetical protein